MLKMNNAERVLFLAVPEDAYEELFTDEFGRLTIEEEELRIIIYQPDEKTISKWIK